MDPDDIAARIAEAARSFDAELHTKTYGQTHSEPAQLAYNARGNGAIIGRNPPTIRGFEISFNRSKARGVYGIIL